MSFKSKLPFPGKDPAMKCYPKINQASLTHKRKFIKHHFIFLCFMKMEMYFLFKIIGGANIDAACGFS